VQPDHVHVYEGRRRKDKRGVDLISDVLPFGRLWYDTPDNAIGYAMHSSRSHDAVIRVYDQGRQRDPNARAQGRFLKNHEISSRDISQFRLKKFLCPITTVHTKKPSSSAKLSPGITRRKEDRAGKR
jgi:hypothetical protein